MKMKKIKTHYYYHSKNVELGKFFKIPKGAEILNIVPNRKDKLFVIYREPCGCLTEDIEYRLIGKQYQCLEELNEKYVASLYLYNDDSDRSRITHIFVSTEKGDLHE